MLEREEVMEKETVKVFSHSRLWLYENCPEAYKVKYIDKKYPDLPPSIEAFLGNKVHSALEWLYLQKLSGAEVRLDDVIRFFLESWHNSLSDDLRINNGGDHEMYANKGIKFLINYFMKFQPFDEKVLDLEKKFFFDLDDSGAYKITGYIDRIGFNPNTGEYEVHDYKTNDWLKSQEQVDADRQLAFYHLGLKEMFGSHIKVRLIWHFLAHGISMMSKRSDTELKSLKQETLKLIKRIESTEQWAACGKRWCDWCEFKRMNGIQGYY